MLHACCQCGVLAPKSQTTEVPTTKSVLDKWIKIHNLNLKLRPGIQYICKAHVSNEPMHKLSVPISHSHPSTSNSFSFDEEVKQEDIEKEVPFVDPLVDPKQEQVDEVSYDDFPFEMEQNSYETYEEDSNYSYQQNNYSSECQPTTSTSTMRSEKIEDISSFQDIDSANHRISLEGLSDDQIMSFCVKTSSNLSGFSSFECGMCPEKYSQINDSQSIREHLEAKHSSMMENFVKTGLAALAPKIYSPMSGTIQAKADESLCKFFIKNGLPFKTVYDMNLEMLTFNMNSSYRLPSVEKLTSYLQKIVLDKTNTKSEANDGPITVTFDTTTFENKHYLAFTVHYYQGNNKKKRIVFFREFKMTQSVASSIMSTIINAMDETNIRSPITSVVTGRAEYEEPLENMESFKQVMVCFSENLNKFAESLIAHPVFDFPLKKLREFILKFPTNRKDWSRFKQYIVRKRTYGEYPEAAEGHWITTLDFITKCLHMHRLFSEFTTANPHIQYVTVEDNVNIVYLHSLLNLCKNAFKTLSDPSSNMADVIPVINTINESLHITTSSNVVIEAVHLVFNRFLHPFVHQSDIHRFSLFLHPRRHGSSILPPCEWDSIKKSIIRHIAYREGAPISKTGKIIPYKEKTTIEKEIIAYSSFVGSVTGVETEVVDWWTRHASKFPRLFKYAIEIYQIPPCSIDASFYLGDYGLLTYSLNETEQSKKKMLLDAASDLVEYRSKSEIMCKPICVKRKKDSGCPEDVWCNPIDSRGLQCWDPLDKSLPQMMQERLIKNTGPVARMITHQTGFVPPPYVGPKKSLREALGLLSTPIQKPSNIPTTHPYSRPVVIGNELVGTSTSRMIKTEDSFLSVPSTTKKYFAVKTIPSNGQRVIRTMNGQIVKVVSKSQTSTTVSANNTRLVPNSQGKKVYFIRSKTGVTQQLQQSPQ